MVLRHMTQLSLLKQTETTGKNAPGQSIAENEQPDKQKERGTQGNRMQQVIE